MSRLLTRGYSTGASTLAGSVNPITTAAQFGAQDAAHRIDAVHFTGGSSIASTVGYILRVGPSSAQFTDYVLVSDDSSVLNVRIEGLGLLGNNWEVILPTTNARGTAVLIFGS